MPDEITDTGIGEPSIGDDVKFLGDDEKVKEVEEVEEEKEVKEEPEKEPKEEEEEVKEEVEEEEKEEVEEDETKDQVRARPAFKEITAKYPNLFKDFPDLREMYFREQEYTKAFPTVEDAKEAVETVEKFNQLDELVTEGSPETISEFMNFIKESDSEVHEKFVSNFLPALMKSSPDDYYRIMMPVSQDLISAVYAEGNRSSNENLKNAALHFALYYFGDKEAATGKKINFGQKVDIPNKEQERFRREREDFARQRYEMSLNDVETSIQSTLKKEITKGLINFNEFMTKTLTKEILTETDLAITKDSQTKAKMSSLWKQAEKAGFSKESTDRIVSAYLSRARQLYPEIRKRLSSAALSDKKKSDEETLKKSKEITNRRDITSGGQQRTSNVFDPSKVDYRKTSDRDILDGRVALKR